MLRDLFDVSGDGVVLRVHVHPGAGRTQVVGVHGDALKVRVASPPQDGRANQAVVDLVAEVLHVGADTVELTGGPTSREKRVTVTGIDADEVERLLQLAVDGDGRPGEPKTRRAR